MIERDHGGALTQALQRQAGTDTMANAFQFRALRGSHPKESITDAKAEDAIQSLPSAPSQDAPVTGPSGKLLGNLDDLKRSLEHARRDADQMIGEMSALEVEASQIDGLKSENAELRNRLDQATSELGSKTAKVECAMREVARLKEEVARIRELYEASDSEASANAMKAAGLEDRLGTATKALDEAKHDLKVQREAREEAELDVECLQTALAQRSEAHSALLRSQTELQTHNARLQSQVDETKHGLRRKEQLIAEQSDELVDARERVATLETQLEAAREELRIVKGSYSDLEASCEARILSLKDEIDVQHESNRLVRMELEEERARREDRRLNALASLPPAPPQRGHSEETGDEVGTAPFMAAPATQASLEPVETEKVEAAPVSTRNVARIRRR